MFGKTIKDVAKYANVSVATVSRVINNSDKVKPETVAIVQKAIKECNYYANSVARNLKTNNTRIIGIVISDISNSYFSMMAKIIEDKLRENDYSMIICSTEENKQQELEYLNFLLSHKVDGLIINTTNLNDEFVTRISNNIPLVAINRRINDINFNGDFVDSNNFAGTELMTKYLIDNGHRKIGIINGELRLSTGAERFAGFVHAMKSINVDVGKDYIYRYDAGHFSVEGGLQGAQYLTQLPNPPTAIIVANNAMTIGAMKYFKSKNIDVPNDISFMAYGDIVNNELLYVQPHYASLNPYVIGQKAADFILKRIENPGVINREAIFATEIIEGNSVKSL